MNLALFIEMKRQFQCSRFEPSLGRLIARSDVRNLFKVSELEYNLASRMRILLEQSKFRSVLFQQNLDDIRVSMFFTLVRN